MIFILDFLNQIINKGLDTCETHKEIYCINYKFDYEFRHKRKVSWELSNS